MLAKGGQVFRSAVALVLRETILRIELIVFLHPAVALYFCEDRGGCDRGGTHVAMDQSLLLDGQIEFERVEEEIIRGRLKLRNGGAHRLAAGLIDVPGIDTASVDFGDSPGQSVQADTFGENKAALGIYFLGIVEANDATGGTEDDSSGNHRAEQRSPARFVEPGDTKPAALPRFAFVTPRAEPFHVREF